MENNNSGETSRKKGPDINENDRPLKKAKYLWQIKGKYHLKENGKILNAESIDNSNKDGEVPIGDIECNNENNINEVLTCNNNIPHRNNNLCCDKTCIEALIANSDEIMDFPELESPPKSVDKANSDEVPITLVKPSPKNEDYYLRKWQARQIAKGFVDNTINRVLESWMIAPFDAADFVENCDNGGQVEDEGILMAIQSHGLQSGTRDIAHNDILFQSSSRLSKCEKSNFIKSYENSLVACTCSRNRTESNSNDSITPFHHRSTDNDFSIEYYENLCILKDNEQMEPTNFHSSISDKTAHSSDMEDAIDIDSSIIPSDDRSEAITNDNIAYEPLKMNDSEFLDAAVTAAIQKKGLTSYNCVDCG